MEQFRALVADKTNEETKMNVKELGVDDLTDGEVLIDVHYSSVNYKDGMVAVKGSIADHFPIVPGIDLAGKVIESDDDSFKPGDDVIATSYHIGTRNYGGFSEVARVPSEWVLDLPDGLTLKEAMTIGTAGFTAALSIMKLERGGLEQSQGKVLVAGASGGVGSLAVNMLSQLGYDVEASTGRTDEAPYLKTIGASRVIHRDDVMNEDGEFVRKRQWSAAIDPVGGNTTEFILASMEYGGRIASCGLAGGVEVNTSVLPFISRGIQWIGVDSVKYPMTKRKEVWHRLARDLKPTMIDGDIVNEVSLDDLPVVLNDIMLGKIRGRVVVNLKA